MRYACRGEMLTGWMGKPFAEIQQTIGNVESRVYAMCNKTKVPPPSPNTHKHAHATTTTTTTALQPTAIGILPVSVLSGCGVSTVHEVFQPTAERSAVHVG